MADQFGLSLGEVLGLFSQLQGIRRARKRENRDDLTFTQSQLDRGSRAFPGQDELPPDLQEFLQKNAAGGSFAVNRPLLNTPEGQRQKSAAIAALEETVNQESARRKAFAELISRFPEGSDRDALIALERREEQDRLLRAFVTLQRLIGKRAQRDPDVGESFRGLQELSTAR